MNEELIARAEFDPRVKRYWMVLWMIICLLTGIGIILMPIVALVIAIVSQKILDAMSASLYERKLVVKRGVLFRVEKTIPLEKITDVGMTQGPLMRFFGLDRLNFETAGQSGPGALVSMIGIREATTFRETILEQKDTLVDKHSAEPRSAAPSEQDPLADLVESVRNIERLLHRHLNQDTPESPGRGGSDSSGV